MPTVIGASIAFCFGASFMKSSERCTRLLPSIVVLISFAIGAVLLSRAVWSHGMSTTFVLGLGIEAAISVGIGAVVLRERLSALQVAGVVLIVAGAVCLRAEVRADHQPPGPPASALPSER